MTRGNRLAVWLVVTVVVAALFGVFVWYQQDALIALEQDLETASSDLFNAEARIDSLSTALQKAVSNQPESTEYQEVVLQEAGVLFELPDAWSKPVVTQIEDAREMDAGRAVELQTDMGLRDEGTIWYKSSDFAPGREHVEGEVFGANLEERGGLAGFCEAGAYRGTAIADCQTQTIAGQTYVTFVTGNRVSLEGEDRIPVFVAIGSLPTDTYTLLNFSLPLAENPLTPSEFDKALNAIEAGELNAFVSQTAFSIIDAGKHAVDTLAFFKPTKSD